VTSASSASTDAKGITLHQAHYAQRILQLGKMEDCNPAATLIEEKLKLSRESTAEEVDPTQYRRLIGSLRYLVHTWPDLAFAIGYLSRFMERPMMEHQQATNFSNEVQSFRLYHNQNFRIAHSN
jgi:hypothetical protein